MCAATLIVQYTSNNNTRHVYENAVVMTMSHEHTMMTGTYYRDTRKRLMSIRVFHNVSVRETFQWPTCRIVENEHNFDSPSEVNAVDRALISHPRSGSFDNIVNRNQTYVCVRVHTTLCTYVRVYVRCHARFSTRIRRAESFFFFFFASAAHGEVLKT